MTARDRVTWAGLGALANMVVVVAWWVAAYGGRWGR